MRVGIVVVRDVVVLWCQIHYVFTAGGVYGLFQFARMPFMTRPDL